MMRPLSRHTITFVAGIHGLAFDDITGRAQRHEVSTARTVACWLLARQGYTPSAIGRAISKDHSSVRAALDRIERSPLLLRHALACEQTLNRLAREASA